MCKKIKLFFSTKTIVIHFIYNITQEILPPIRVTVTTNSSKSTAQKFSFLEVDTNKGVIFPTCHFAELTGFLMSLPQQAGFAFPRGGGAWFPLPVSLSAMWMCYTSGITTCMCYTSGISTCQWLFLEYFLSLDAPSFLP